jgi:hypothetical protein
LNFGFPDLFRNAKVGGLGPCFMDHGLGPVHDGLTWWRGQETTGERPGWHSGLPVLAGVCREGEGRCGGLTTGLTGAQGVTERPGDSGEVVAVVGLGGDVF